MSQGMRKTGKRERMWKWDEEEDGEEDDVRTLSRKTRK